MNGSYNHVDRCTLTDCVDSKEREGDTSHLLTARFNILGNGSDASDASHTNGGSSIVHIARTSGEHTDCAPTRPSAPAATAPAKPVTAHCLPASIAAVATAPR